MDDFVHNKLTEWGFSDLIQIFKDEEIDQEALFGLEDHEIDKLINTAGKRTKFKIKLKLLKSQQECQEPAPSSQSQQECQEPAPSAQVLPSTSNSSDPVKRKLEPRGEENKNQSPNKRQCNAVTGTYEEYRKLGEVKRIMSTVHDRLQNYDRTELNDFLRKEINDLETDKREVVGVFGKTGAGKSYLINAIIGEKHLLPSGSVSACTTVMIKVEANTENQKYEAHIEFIRKEEWKDELWSFKNLCGDNGDEDGDNGEEDGDNGEEDSDSGEEENKSTRDDDDEYRDSVEKLTALYGDQWKNKLENLMEPKYFKEVPEFLQSKKKIFSCNSAKELSAKYRKYTRSGATEENSEEERFYWPLVKCVTVKVPNNHLLQHVTLVDLPGNGDRNKSRDQMWKTIVGNCSTVWIVAEINRAATETESWEILKTASSLMGNGGECQNIHFICTKTDDIDEDSDADAGHRIFKRNMEMKKIMKKQFNTLKDIKKQFRDDCFTVYTVSAKEFLQKKLLKPEDTEIPELQVFLQNLNNQHSETLNYVFGAYGILSLMKAARCGDVAAKKTSVCEELVKIITHEKEKVRKPMEEAYGDLEKHLHTSVEKSKESCEKALEKILNPSGKAKRGFHNKLKCAVKNNGISKPGKKTKKGMNMNMTLSSLLSDSIDEEFKNTFPNDGNSGPFYGAVSKFTLDTKKLIQNYNDLELQLIFLNTEEEKMKAKLCKIIRHRKKTIYNCLTETIEETMRECYTRAAEVRGKESLNNMKKIILNHVHQSKATMFDSAKDDLLTQLTELMRDILKTLTDTMQRSIEVSLMNDNSIPDISVEHALVQRYYEELKGPDEETSLLWPDMLDDSVDSPGSAAAAETSDFRFQ